MEELAVELLLGLVQQAGTIQQLIANSRASGQPITADQLAALRSAAQASGASLDAAIAAAS